MPTHANPTNGISYCEGYHPTKRVTERQRERERGSHPPTVQEIAPLGMKLVAGGSAVADLVSIRRRNEGDTALTTQTTSRRRVFVGVCTRRVCVVLYV